MSVFERYLTVWVFLWIVIGIALGQFLPGAFQTIGALSVAQVNLPGVLCSQLWSCCAILIQVLFNSALAYGLNRAVGESHSVACPSALISASNFFELAVPSGSREPAIVGTPYAELDLADPRRTDEELVDHMLAHPILINRPIVVTPWGVKLCRPSEAVLDILPLPQRAPFAKQDGELVIDSQGDRVTTAS